MSKRVKGALRQLPTYGVVLASFILMMVCRGLGAATALPQFAYRELIIAVAQADGKPLADASVYGWCRELNLICPRRDKEYEGRNDVIWHDSYLGKTGSDGGL